MTSSRLDLVVPGPLGQLTGGYIYDASIVVGLGDLGCSVRVHALEGRFPEADAIARDALDAALASLPDGARVVIDGLAMGGLPAVVETHGRRLRILSLVHHPLAEETGISPDAAERLRSSERRALAACRGVLVSSPYTARVLEAYGVAPRHVRVVVPGTEPVPPAEGPGAGRPPVLLCVASVTPRKGHDVLVAALDRVRDLEWTCVCVGGLDRDRPHASAVLRRVDELGLADRIELVGEREGEALASLYHGASAFVLASHYEGYGMALAEALARGLPVVSTTGGAIPFTVPPDCGLLVPAGDSDAFGEALRALLGEGSRRQELARAARRHADTLPSWRDAAESFASAVEELTR